MPLVPAPLMPARGTSTRGAHTFGGPFSGWGALVGTALAAEGEQAFIANCSRCHQIDGLTTPEGDPVVSAPDQWVYSGAAPNLTNFMTRNTFAGASWDLLTDDCRDAVWNASPEEFGAAYLEGVTPECLNQVDLRAADTDSYRYYRAYHARRKS